MFSSRITTDSNVSSSSHLLIGNSPQRKTLTVFASGNDTVTISNNPGVVTGTGIVLIPGMAPLYLDADYHGDCVQREWYVIYVTGGMPVTYIEAMM